MRPLVDRFWEKVEKTEGCWNWKGAKAYPAYGFIRDEPSNNSRMLSAHRWSYEQTKGKIPEGFQIDHLCRNTGCVNPRHLEAVPGRANVLRGAGFSAKNAFKTHCVRGHEFTPDNTYQSKRKGGGIKRACKACILLRQTRNFSSFAEPVAAQPFENEGVLLINLQANKWRWECSRCQRHCSLVSRNIAKQRAAGHIRATIHNAG